MRINQITNETQIDEGPHDPATHKAVFLAGGPGSGKSFIVRATALEALGFKVINNDTQFEKYLAQAGMTTTPDDIYSQRGQQIRSHAKEITNKQMQLFLQGSLGLAIDGTGKDYDKITAQAQKLNRLGYETAMIFVNTDLETALTRNRQRKRTLPDQEVDKMWTAVQKNIGKFQSFFGADMYIIDNSLDSDAGAQINKLFVRIKKWAGSAKKNNKNT